MLFRNTVAQTAVLFTAYVFSFVLAPIMLARLGLAQFGVWAVTGAFATYAGVMDLGITRALGRFVAYYHAQGDRRAVEQCFTLGLMAVSFVWLVASLAAIFAAPIVARSLDHVLTSGQMRVVLLSSVGISATNAWRNVMRSVPQGMQQFVPPNLAEMSFNTVNFVLSIVALVLSRELTVYALANVAAGVIGLAFGLIALRHVVGSVRVRLPSRPVVREVLGFSLKNQLSWIADMGVGQGAKIIIAVFLDVRLAGAYELGSRAVSAAKAVAVLSVSAMVPTATARIVTEGTGILRDFYRRYTVRSLSVSLPLLMFLCAGAPVLLVTWLGKVPNDSMAVFIVLTLANCVNLSTGVAYTLDLAMGRAGVIAWVSLSVAVVTIAAMLLLAPIVHLAGVIAGVAFGTLFGAVFYLVRFHRYHRVPAVEYARSAGPPALLAALAGAPIALAWLFVDAPRSRPPALLASLACLAVYVAIYWPLASRLGFLPERLRLGRVRRAAARRWRARQAVEAA